MADVVFSKISKRFGRTVALENLDLTVEDGEFVSLVTPRSNARSVESAAAFPRWLVALLDAA